MFNDVNHFPTEIDEDDGERKEMAFQTSDLPRNVHVEGVLRADFYVCHRHFYSLVSLEDIFCAEQCYVINEKCSLSLRENSTMIREKWHAEMNSNQKWWKCNVECLKSRSWKWLVRNWMKRDALVWIDYFPQNPGMHTLQSHAALSAFEPWSLICHVDRYLFSTGTIKRLYQWYFLMFLICCPTPSWILSCTVCDIDASEQIRFLFVLYQILQRWKATANKFSFQLHVQRQKSSAPPVGKSANWAESVKYGYSTSGSPLFFIYLVWEALVDNITSTFFYCNLLVRSWHFDYNKLHPTNKRTGALCISTVHA